MPPLPMPPLPTSPLTGCSAGAGCDTADVRHVRCSRVAVDRWFLRWLMYARVLWHFLCERCLHCRCLHSRSLRRRDVWLTRDAVRPTFVTCLVSVCRVPIGSAAAVGLLCVGCVGGCRCLHSQLLYCRVASRRRSTNLVTCSSVPFDAIEFV